MSPRAKSASTLANDKKILDTALAAAHKLGLANLRFSHVIEKTGLSSGALYARYLDHADMTAALWDERLHAPTMALLDYLSNALPVSGSVETRNLAVRLANLSKEEVVGLEAIMIARRLPELDELVARDLEAWLQSSGFADESLDGRVRMAVSLSTTLGCMFNSQIDPNVEEWAKIFPVYSMALDSRKAVSASAPRRIKGEPVVSKTGDPLRDALIDATAAVIARSGTDGATLSRIARRARLTSGAVYTLYEGKDALIDDALRELLNIAATESGQVVAAGAAIGDEAGATATLYTLAFAPERKPWRQFRMEVTISARTNRATRTILTQSYRSSVERYQKMYEDRTDVSPNLLGIIARVGRSVPTGLSVAELILPGLDSLDFLPFAIALSTLTRP